MTEIVFGWVYVPFSQQLGKCLLYWVGWEMGPVHLRIEYEHKRYNLLLRWVLPFYCRKGICHRPFSSFHHDEMMVENRREYHINLNLMVSYDVCSCYLHSNTKRFPLLARIWRRCPGSRPPRKKNPITHTILIIDWPERCGKNIFIIIIHWVKVDVHLFNQIFSHTRWPSMGHRASPFFFLLLHFDFSSTARAGKKMHNPIVSYVEAHGILALLYFCSFCIIGRPSSCQVDVWAHSDTDQCMYFSDYPFLHKLCEWTIVSRSTCQIPIEARIQV